MGDCLFSRSSLSSLLHARDRYLSDSGLILPDKVEIFIAAVCTPAEKADAVEYWTEPIYGYDMSCARPVCVQ
jgi:hypothetical protein